MRLNFDKLLSQEATDTHLIRNILKLIDNVGRDSTKSHSAMNSNILNIDLSLTYFRSIPAVIICFHASEFLIKVHPYIFHHKNWSTLERRYVALLMLHTVYSLFVLIQTWLQLLWLRLKFSMEVINTFKHLHLSSFF